MSVVNLRLARKAKARAEREVTAGTNRLLHGRSRAERTTQAIETSRATRNLDNHRLEGRLDRAPSPDDGD